MDILKIEIKASDTKNEMINTLKNLFTAGKKYAILGLYAKGLYSTK